MDNIILTENSMEILTQPNNQTRFECETPFDRNSRENYFEKLKVALKNLSIVDDQRKGHSFLAKE